MIFIFDFIIRNTKKNKKLICLIYFIFIQNNYNKLNELKVSKIFMPIMKTTLGQAQKDDLSPLSIELDENLINIYTNDEKILIFEK